MTGPHPLKEDSGGTSDALEYPMTERPDGPLDAIRDLERRAGRRKQQLRASLRRLDAAVRRRMPRQVVQRRADESPYGVMAIALAAGFLLGALT